MSLPTTTTAKFDAKPPPTFPALWLVEWSYSETLHSIPSDSGIGVKFSSKFVAVIARTWFKARAVGSALLGVTDLGAVRVEMQCDALTKEEVRGYVKLGLRHPGMMGHDTTTRVVVDPDERTLV